MDVTDLIQVDAEHYFNISYVTFERFASYFHQIEEVLKIQPKKVLEIGIGNGIVSYFLKKAGLDVTTLDIDERLKPDVIGSVENIPFENESFDVVLCYEVLEHLPYDKIKVSISEINRVTSKYALISIPDVNWYLSLIIFAPRINRKSIIVNIRRLWRRRHVFNGEHYWEIGKKGYSLGKVLSDFESVGFEVEKTYRAFASPYHRFFILSKKNTC